MASDLPPTVPAEQQQELSDEQIGQIKRDIIEHYDKIQCQIDVRTETLLQNLPEALEKGRAQLLERVREEKEKNMAALAEDSPVMRFKNEYYQRFLTLKEEYTNSGDNAAKKEEIKKQLEVLKKDMALLEEFLEDFKSRTLCFEEADRSVYSALIGELVTNEESNVEK
jgi:pyruvate-formate lyase